MRPLRYLAVRYTLAALPLCSCAEAIPGPSGDQSVAVQGLLVLGASRQSVWVEWITPADSEFTPIPRPVAPALVELSLVLPNGGQIGFVPAPSVAGRFDANTSLQSGATYGLIGTIAGRGISAQTVTPTQLQVELPAADTITVASNSCGLFCELPFRWRASGAELFEYTQRGPAGLFRSITSDTVGLLRLVPTTGTTLLTVLAYDHNAAAFLSATAPGSSIDGAFGFFGSASVVERVIRWQ